MHAFLDRGHGMAKNEALKSFVSWSEFCGCFSSVTRRFYVGQVQVAIAPVQTQYELF
jgi:hypothetical protein